MPAKVFQSTSGVAAELWNSLRSNLRAESKWNQRKKPCPVRTCRRHFSLHVWEGIQQRLCLLAETHILAI
jgi:hypothetical protein